MVQLLFLFQQVVGRMNELSTINPPVVYIFLSIGHKMNVLDEKNELFQI